MQKPTVKIDWMRGYGNSPRIILEGIKVPAWPHKDDPVWQKVDGFHYCRKGPFVFYFHTDGRPTEGYGGRIFEGTFIDGSTFRYKGAWSSRAGALNRMLRFCEYIVDVSADYCAVAVSADYLCSIWNHDSEVRLRLDDGYHEKSDIVYNVTHRGKQKGEPGFEYPNE